MEANILKCKICGETFVSPKELNAHLKDSHKKGIKNYWEENFPIYNLVNGNKISYKSVDSYFSSLFENREQMIFWLNHSEDNFVKTTIVDLLKNRIEIKGLNSLPCEVENITTKVPNIKYFVKLLGGYDEKAIPEISLPPKYSIQHFSKNSPNPKDKTILVDTREQKPLRFKNSKKQKLAIGDYCLGDGLCDGTYIDRKSGSDFRSTMTQGYDRFVKEIERVKMLDSFLFVIVEDSIQGLKRDDEHQKWEQGNLEYAFKNMREIINLYYRNVQFLFTGSRENSQFLYPFILQEGKNIWNLDLQYHLSKKGFVL